MEYHRSSQLQVARPYVLWNRQRRAARPINRRSGRSLHQRSGGASQAAGQGPSGHQTPAVPALNHGQRGQRLPVAPKPGPDCTRHGSKLVRLGSACLPGMLPSRRADFRLPARKGGIQGDQRWRKAGCRYRTWRTRILPKASLSGIDPRRSGAPQRRADAPGSQAASTRAMAFRVPRLQPGQRVSLSVKLDRGPIGAPR